MSGISSVTKAFGISNLKMDNLSYNLSNLSATILIALFNQLDNKYFLVQIQKVKTEL